MLNRLFWIGKFKANQMCHIDSLKQTQPLKIGILSKESSFPNFQGRDVSLEPIISTPGVSTATHLGFQQTPKQ